MKIVFCGSKKENKLEETLFNDEIKPFLINNERTDRLVIQSFIDKNNIKSSILYNGNSVFGKNKILKELHKIIKAEKLTNMSDYFYHFITNHCGSIAHYDKNGWIAEYDNNIEKLMIFFQHNEFGTNILNAAPEWYTDLKVIAEEILKISEDYQNNSQKIDKKKTTIKKDINSFQMDFFSVMG
jgi:hypothetical protein